MKIFKNKFLIDLQKCILWQYDKSTKLKSLITQKESWYKTKVTDFLIYFFWSIFNIDTANTFGLNVWGRILNLSRNVVFVGGQTHYLTDTQYRFLLKGQIVKFSMKDLSVNEINKYLKIICNEEDNNQCFVLDKQDMSITYIITKNFGVNHTEIIQLFNYYDFLPRPAGVELNVVLNYNGYFGFEGAGTNRGGFSTTAEGYTDEEGGIFL